MAEVNVFDEQDAQPVPGLEHLGKGIVDAQGVPSGSPANWEKLRGVPSDNILTEAEKAAAVEKIKAEFGE